MTKISILTFCVSISLSLSACGNDSANTGTDTSPSASSEKEGAITMRIINKAFRDSGGGKGWCNVSIAEINNSGRDLRTFQISQYESQTSLGITKDNSTNYKGLKNGTSRISKLDVLATSCKEVKKVTIATLLCNFTDTPNATCDNNTQYLFEGALDTELTSTFKPR